MADALPAHIMLDLETFGNGNDAVIVSIGAVKFNVDEILEEFHVGVDPASCVALGLKMDVDTILWWMQPERAEARDALFALEKVDLMSALSGFTEWVGSDDGGSLWGNGSTFDNVILRSAYRVCGMEYPFYFWQDQCYRTMKYRVPEVSLVREGTHHDALDDARCQAKHLQQIVTHLGVPL